MLGFEDPGADYGFLVTASGDANGVRVNLKADRAAGKLAIKLQDATAFAIIVEKIDGSGDQVFYHAGNTLGPNDTAYLKYGMWPGNGMALEMDVDADSDGTIDQTVMLTDDGN